MVIRPIFLSGSAALLLGFAALLSPSFVRAQGTNPVVPDASAPGLPAGQALPAAPAQGQPGRQPLSAPQAPAATPAVPKSAAQRFPFPGAAAVPDIPPIEGEVPYVPEGRTAPAPSPSSSSNSSSSSSSSSASDGSQDSNSPGLLPRSDGASPSSSANRPDPAEDQDGAGLKDAGSSGDGTRKGRRRLPKVNVQTDEDRADEDLKVAEFYRSRGNFRAAYLRAQDAVTVQPESPDAHFELAKVAQEMQKQDQAAAQYKEYLRLEPTGERAKTAKRALEQLANP